MANKRTVKYYVDVDSSGTVRGSGKAIEALDEIDKKAQATGKSSVKMAEELSKASTETAQLGNQAGRTTQRLGHTTFAVTNFNRILSDANYGIIGVSNNIDPMLQSFQYLKEDAGSTKGALVALLKGAFTGSGALLTITTLVTSALTFIALHMRGLGSESKAASKNLKLINSALDNLQKYGKSNTVFDPLGLNDTQKQIQNLQSIKDNLQKIFDLQKQQKSLQSDVLNMGIAQGGFAGKNMADEQFAALQKVNKQLDKRNKLLGAAADIDQKDIEKRLKKLQNTQAINEALVKMNPAMQFQIKLNKQFSPVLQDVNLGLSGSKKELTDLISRWQHNASGMRQIIENGNLTGDALQYMESNLSAIIKALDQATQAQSKFNKASAGGSGSGSSKKLPVGNVGFTGLNANPSLSQNQANNFSFLPSPDSIKGLQSMMKSVDQQITTTQNAEDRKRYQNWHNFLQLKIQSYKSGISVQQSLDQQTHQQRISKFQQEIQFMQQGMSTITTFMHEMSQQRIQGMQREEDQRLAAIDAQLSAENISASEQKRLTKERQQIQSEYNKKIKAEKRKEFRREKEAKMIEAAMNTAVAVTKVWGQTGIFGLAAQWPVIAMGALEEAVIAAQPNPYLTGGLTTPGKKLISINENAKPEYIVNARSTQKALPLLDAINRDPGLAAALSNTLVSPSGNLINASNNDNRPLPQSGGIQTSDIVRAIRSGFEKVQMNTTLSMSEVNAKGDKLKQRETFIGN